MGEENSSGDLQKSYVFHPGWGIWQAMLAEVPGDDPSTGDYAFYHMDMHGSMRQARDDGGALIAAQDYEPYGGTLLAVGAGLSHGYTGHPQSPYTGMYTTEKIVTATYFCATPTGLSSLRICLLQ